MRARLFSLATGLMLILLLISCTGAPFGVTGSGKTETRKFDHTGFTKLDIGAAFEYDVSRADTYAISITLDDNLFQYLDIEESDDTLHIRFKPQASIRFDATHKASIAMPDLRGLDGSGASKGKVSGFNVTHPLKISLSGASSLSAENIKAGDTELEISGASKLAGGLTAAQLKINLSGASQLELKGTATDIEIEASGASAARLDDFAIVNADVNLSGASNATIRISGRLEGELSGASKLLYIGNPTLGKMNTSGGSSFGQK